MMTEEKKTHWLTRRLEELGKSKRQLALAIGVHPTRMNDLENGLWKFQTAHVRKAAEYLEFDRTAFLDFLSGDITEEELWKSEPQEKISPEDLALLRAVKTFAARPTTEDKTADSPQSQPVPSKQKGKSR
jgi:transcriptional regulator with XRE-family HTH domain